MADYASDCPISRPVDPGWTSDWDLGGMQWSYDYGMFYQPSPDELLPLRKPAQRVGE
ncbi:hypothetical protein Cali_129 [Mycobacterium phage Cali]|uniref:Uncharacterized protein n=46 Tax=Bixzunavirus TaxID=680114 RepID=Q853F0_BPMBZ|nr:gp131 [Mycobacterium phage Bxz1]YP_002224158.1 hypothetical protein SCOTTMCG_130 [Mycobacterium phage ScottMcG]YP_002224382.1 gp133 [Mycobacterium phage Spud]YP_002224602.1 gp129 [Mycobacterium phage Cali]YP_002224822.1 gp129 [Mycobacterium phage Rizal]YP_003347801.1 hypothetical protein ET08_122 [Mycobacterium phage ET08]YP_008060933.1 hypothetical protein M181_gp194 [Mycobacterium phage Gizmo]YP_008061389.1 hypothetical protein M180_gp191 [Mycobacterium phage ArcherS7]YP_008061622.1 hy